MKYLLLIAFIIAMPFLPMILNKISHALKHEQKAKGENNSKINEALKILEVPRNASEDEIKSAHKRLITKNHPDAGGSKYLASKINEARDILLKNLKDR